MPVCMSVYHHLSAGDRTEPRVLGLFGKFNPHPPWSLSYFQPTFSIYIWFTVESAPSDMRTDCKSMFGLPTKPLRVTVSIVTVTII